MPLPEFPTEPGTYLLLLHLKVPVAVQIGKLGQFAFAVGTLPTWAARTVPAA